VIMAGKIRLLMGSDTAVEIIGVVNDIRQVAMAEPAMPTMYLHNLQNSRSKTTIVARTKVRMTGDMVPSQSPNVRLMMVRVGKTQSQIIRAS